MKRTADYLNELAQKSSHVYVLSEDERSKLKAVLLSMYIDLKEICDKNGIDVMLSGGSCIGAVRHKGFIPWDEDIDLMMAREDYDRFIDILKCQYSDKYEISAPRLGKPSVGLMLKIYKKNSKGHGMIVIDVFPIEKASNSRLVRNIRFVILDMLRVFVLSSNLLKKNKSAEEEVVYQVMMSSLSGRVHYYTRCMIGKFVNFIGRQRLIDFYDRIASRSSGTIYRTINTGRGMSKKECLPADVFFPPMEVEFCGVKSLIPHDSDRYLSNLYGDYVTMPPVEKRERHFYTKVEFDGQ